MVIRLFLWLSRFYLELSFIVIRQFLRSQGSENAYAMSSHRDAEVAEFAQRGVSGRRFSGNLLDFDNAAFDANHRRMGTIVGAQLRQDVPDVPLHRIFRRR
jgi:hypothetical protein